MKADEADIQNEIAHWRNSHSVGIHVMTAYRESEQALDQAIDSLAWRAQKPAPCGCGKEHRENMILVHPELIREMIGRIYAIDLHS